MVQWNLFFIVCSAHVGFYFELDAFMMYIMLFLISFCPLRFVAQIYFSQICINNAVGDILMLLLNGLKHLIFWDYTSSAWMPMLKNTDVLKWLVLSSFIEFNKCVFPFQIFPHWNVYFSLLLDLKEREGRSNQSKPHIFSEMFMGGIWSKETSVKMAVFLSCLKRVYTHCLWGGLYKKAHCKKFNKMSFFQK